ncbi:MAG: hypothetical protein ABH873_07965 [Candidatus Firestonebacteria bacterium]
MEDKYLKNGKPTGVEFNVIYEMADECITGPPAFRKQRGFLRSEPYFYGVIWNELYRLPLNSFLVPFLKKIGIKTKEFKIERVEVTPMFHLESQKGRIMVRPDIFIESDKNLIFFEFKNLSSNKGSFQEKQLSTQFVAGLKQNPNKDFFYITITNKEGSSALVKKSGNSDIFSEIGSFSDEYLSEESENVRKSFKRNYKRENVIVMSWDSFLENVFDQIKYSKRNTDDEGLKETYSRVKERIKAFVEERKSVYFYS